MCCFLKRRSRFLSYYIIVSNSENGNDINANTVLNTVALIISATVFKTVFALMLITVSSLFQFQIIPGTPRPKGLDIAAFNITSNPMCQKFETANTSKNFCKVWKEEVWST